MSNDIPNKISNFFADFAEQTFAKGEVITQAESEPTGVYYIVDGRVNQYEISQSGNSIVVNIFKPGAFFPMSWAINHTPNRYFFEAATKLIVRQAPADDAVNFLKTNPEVMFDLLARVYRGSDGVLRRMAHLMGGSARNRLLFELLNAAYRFGEADGNKITVPLSESDIAKHSGLSRETVSRAMQSLKADGLIEVTKRGLAIKDISQLEAILGSDL